MLGETWRAIRDAAVISEGVKGIPLLDGCLSQPHLRSWGQLILHIPENCALIKINRLYFID